jgi:hypothetical protein
VAAAVRAVVGGTRTSEAQGAIEMGVDMEVTGNSADTLGTLERCYEIDWSGTPFDGIADWTIDVYVRGDTQAPISYDAWVTYNDARVHVVAPTDTLIKIPGASDYSDSLPDSDGQFNAGAFYLDPPYNGIPGDGALVRIGLDIGARGIVTFGFAKGGYRSEAGLHTVTTVPALLAINSRCPPVGGIAELPDMVSGGDSSGRRHIVLAGAAAVGAIVAAAGAIRARRRSLG